MATRTSSRRSAGGADGFNRAMIGILPISRLKEELEKRGLPTDGNKDTLSARLEDCVNGTYVPPAVPSPSTSKDPVTPKSKPVTTPKRTSRRSSTKEETPKSPPKKKRRNSVKGVKTEESEEEEEEEEAPQKSPLKKKRKNSPKEVKTEEGEEEEEKDEVEQSEAAPKKQRSTSKAVKTEPEEEEVARPKSIQKKRRNSTKKVEEEDSDGDEDLPVLVQEDPMMGEECDASKADFDSEDDEPLVKDDSKKKKQKRRRTEDEDRETGLLLDKDDSEWVPPEDAAKKESPKKRTRRSTADDRKLEHESAVAAVAAVTAIKMDVEIFDKDDSTSDSSEARKRPPVAQSSPSQQKSSDEKPSKQRRDSDRHRTNSVTGPSSSKDTKEGSGSSKIDKRRDTIGSSSSRPPPPPKEKPATQRFAELMAQKKREEQERAAREAAAAAAQASATDPASTSSLTTVSSSSSIKKEDEDSRSPSDVTAVSATKIEGAGAVAKKKSTDGVKQSSSFLMQPRRNAPPRPPPTITPVVASSPLDLVDNIMGKQQSLLEKRHKTSAEAEAEKMAVVSQINERAPDQKNREERIKEHKERIQRDKERQEMEKRERERKLLVITAANRPIPGPPPLPPNYVKKSPVDAAAPLMDPYENKQQPTVVLVSSHRPLPPPPPPPRKSSIEMTKPVVVVDDIAPPPFEPLSPLPGTSSQDDPMPYNNEPDHSDSRRHSNGHVKGEKGLVAPSFPIDQDPFLLQLSSKLAAVKAERDTSPPPREVHECMEALLDRVAEKVERELKWERRTARRSLMQIAAEADSAAAAKDRAEMMANPRAFLAKASDILKNMKSVGTAEEDAAASAAAALQISQQIAEPGTYVEEKEDRPLPEFHGEPVPSDDDMDAIFAEAAGLPKKEKKPKHPVVEEEAPPSHEHIEMDYYNACLHVKSDKDKSWLIDPENENGLALMWGGVRCNHGLKMPWKNGDKKFVFQIKVTEHLSIRHIPFTEHEAHDARIGFSFRGAPNVLGEFPQSWGFSVTGKKCTNNVFQEWGHPCEIGDVVTAVLDFNAGSISYYKNDECMGVAFSGLTFPEDEAVYAHICVKNVRLAFNLGSFPEVEGGWGERQPDWIFPSEIERNQFEMSRLAPSEKASCTVLLMVGLPGVGKTTWVRQYTRDHPEELWNVINSEVIMSAMKVNGVPRARAHIGRWDMVLGLVAKAIAKSVLLAARRRRNYIVDLSNVSKDSRKRRLIHFKDFTKKCVVICPDEEEMVSRQMKQQRQEGVSHVPAEAILEMKAVYSFPNEEQEGFDEVFLIEPAMPHIAVAIDIIQKFNEEGKPWYQKRYRGRLGRRGRGGGGYQGDRRGSDFNRPLSVNTNGLNGSGPPSSVGSRPGGGGSYPDRRSVNSPAWTPGAYSTDSPSSAGVFTWANRKSS